MKKIALVKPKRGKIVLGVITLQPFDLSTISMSFRVMTPLKPSSSPLFNLTKAYLVIRLRLNGHLKILPVFVVFI